jgi:hypothetical protein
MTLLRGRREGMRQQGKGHSRAGWRLLGRCGRARDGAARTQELEEEKPKVASRVGFTKVGCTRK